MPTLLYKNFAKVLLKLSLEYFNKVILCEKYSAGFETKLDLTCFDESLKFQVNQNGTRYCNPVF
jgi:hypothetical protein